MHTKVFCIGLSRTGTTALHDILELLGFDGKHYIEEWFSNEDLDVFEPYDVAGDTPVPLIYKQLDKRFPKSKFILTTRSKDDWLSSMKWMFRHGRVIWNWTPALGDYNQKLYGCNRFDRQTLVNAFDEYHTEVKKYFNSRPDDFLEINIDNGFDVAEICKFLEVPFKEIRVERHSDRRNATPFEFIKYYVSYYFLRSVKGIFG